MFRLLRVIALSAVFPGIVAAQRPVVTDAAAHPAEALSPEGDVTLDELVRRLDTNTFDAHARQSHVGALLSGPDLGDFQTGAQILTFFQNDNLSADDYGLLVYYAYGELKNDQWRFAAGLQQDVFNPVSPTIVYLTKLYGSGNTGSYRGQLRTERFFQQDEDLGLTLTGALSEPISTLVTGSALRHRRPKRQPTSSLSDSSKPNLFPELGVGPQPVGATWTRIGLPSNQLHAVCPQCVPHQ